MTKTAGSPPNAPAYAELTVSAVPSAATIALGVGTPFDDTAAAVAPFVAPPDEPVAPTAAAPHADVAAHKALMQRSANPILNSRYHRFCSRCPTLSQL
jgi:hypothetical protein